MHRRLIIGLVTLAALAQFVVLPADVGPISETLRERLDLDPFYAKQIVVDDFPIVGSSRVTEPALREAAWILQHLLEDRPDLLAAMAEQKAKVVVMAWNEYTTDVPEHRHLKPRVYWDRRARGLGGATVSCGEENLLGYPNDPYATENLLIHEFAHGLHGIGLKAVDPTFDRRLQQAYQEAIENGLWEGTYAATNHEEYWAEAVQSWFDDNRENDSLHNHVNTRAELRLYDPALAALCEGVFGDHTWRYRKPTEREPANRAHLAGYDPNQTPRFRWRDEPVPDQPLVRVQTAVGDIELELDRRAAPVTVTNFLDYVHEGLYGDGRFFRTVTTANQADSAVPIEVIQAQADPGRAADFPPPIRLERTRDTKLNHRAGTISMARMEPDTAQDHFFICLTDQPELDFGGARNPDGQGFAAFGRVVKGMEVARKIHQAPAEGEQLMPPIRIQRAIRLN